MRHRRLVPRHPVVVEIRFCAACIRAHLPRAKAPIWRKPGWFQGNFVGRIVFSYVWFLSFNVDLASDFSLQTILGSTLVGLVQTYQNSMMQCNHSLKQNQWITGFKIFDPGFSILGPNMRQRLQTDQQADEQSMNYQDFQPFLHSPTSSNCPKTWQVRSWWSDDLAVSLWWMSHRL